MLAFPLTGGQSDVAEAAIWCARLVVAEAVETDPAEFRCADETAMLDAVKHVAMMMSVGT